MTAGIGNTVPDLTTATVLFFSWASMTHLVRCWVKLRKSDSWGADETSISLSCVCECFMSDGKSIADCGP